MKNSIPILLLKNNNPFLSTLLCLISLFGCVSGLNAQNIGIGTTNPTGKLHVKDNTIPSCIVESSSTVGTWLSIGNTTGSTWFQLIATGTGNGEGANKLLFTAGTSSVSTSTAFMVFDKATSNVGIGTNTPTAKLQVNGTFTATGTKNFTIDHPLDPSNKILRHASIESNEVLNVYSGTIALDEQGKAVVSLPDYCEALNKDFRYQLTCIGAFAQVYIAEEVNKNQFKIAGGTAGLKVSWQVTAVRNDLWMRQHPYKNEEEKPQKEKGTFLYPEGYEQAAEVNEAGNNHH